MKYAYCNRKNGKWYSQFTNPLTGKKIKKLLGTNKKEAQANLKILMDKFGLGANNDGKSYNVAMPSNPGVPGIEWYVARKEYIDTHVLEFNPKHQAFLIALLNKLEDYTGITDVKDYEYKHLQGFINHYKQKVAPTTANKYIGHIRHFFQFCILMGWIKENPGVRIKQVSDDRCLTPYIFTDDELALLLNDPNEFTDWWTFLSETGIRACDAVQFQKSKNFIMQDRLYCTFYQAKNKKKPIKLPLSVKATEIVNKSDEILFPKGMYWLTRKSHYNGFIVQSRKLMRKLLGGNNHPNTLDIKHHTFRHTFAVRWLNNGMPKEVLQTLLGHSSLNTTEMHYANWMSKESVSKWIV